jgi:hypothetical protein
LSTVHQKFRFSESSDGRDFCFCEIVPHRVQGLVMILAGISDLLDTEFSAGFFPE